jgi:hypothetical protein
LSRQAHRELRSEETEAARELDKGGLRGLFNLLNTNLRERCRDAANRSVSDGAASEGDLCYRTSQRDRVDSSLSASSAWALSAC